jgi:hypothetical protein
VVARTGQEVRSRDARVEDAEPVPRAYASRSLFRKTVGVVLDIPASPDAIWRVLTDAAGFPAWNSTVTEIKGDIALGSKLALRVPVSPRTFTPTVVKFDAPRVMIWADGARPMFTGVREYRLEPLGDALTRFTMTETFEGLMMPMIGPSLPDFAPVFEQYAADLKAAVRGG